MRLTLMSVSATVIFYWRSRQNKSNTWVSSTVIVQYKVVLPCNASLSRQVKWKLLNTVHICTCNFGEKQPVWSHNTNLGHVCSLRLRPSVARIIPEPPGQRILDLKITNEFVNLKRFLAVAEVTRVLSVNDSCYIAKNSGVHHSCKANDFC